MNFDNLVAVLAVAAAVPLILAAVPRVPVPGPAPGLVLVSRWRPEDGEPGPDAERAWAYGGVAAI
jgi:hypothetical protein